MNVWISSLLDLVVIAVVAAGLVQATRLIKHLTGLKQGRIDMERFVREFSATVTRAENGIKGLRQAARDTGDDLEKLVEKAALVRDELSFIVQSGENIAERLSQTASRAAQTDTVPKNDKAAKAAPAKPVEQNPHDVATMAGRKAEAVATAPSSRAEKELLQALQKLS